MSKFRVFERELTFSEGMDRLGENVKEAYSLARKECENYRNEYYKAGDIERVLSDYDRYGGSVYEKIKKDLHNRLVNEFDLYSISYDSFSENYCNEFDDHYEAFEEVADEYNAIVAEQEGAKEYRSARKENRGRWEGGGFGMSGAIKGSMEAGAMNLASGAAHGAVNMIGNGIDAIKAAKAKSNLYNRSDVVNTLSEGIGNTVLMMYVGFRKCVNDNYQKDYFEFTGDSDKASALLENLQSISDENKRKELICDALQANPMNEGIYKYSIENYGDSTGVFEKMCSKFSNYDIVGVKETYIDEDLCALDYTQKQAVIEAKGMIAERCQYYHMDDTPYQNALDSIISEYEKAESFCDGYYYDSADDLSKAKTDRDDFIESTNKIDANDEANLISIKGRIEKDYNTQAKDKYLEFINKALNDYDLRYRTVFGDRYETREEADRIKNELKGLIDIKKTISFNSKEEIQDARERTKDGSFFPKIKEKYISMYDECINKWDEINDAQSWTFSNRTEQTELVFKLMNLHDDCRYMGIHNQVFEDFYEKNNNDLLTVNGEKYSTIAEANKNYYKLLFKAQSYKTNVAEKDTAPKKGLFSKVLGEVKGALSSGNLEEYNYFSENGTKEIPNDDKAVRNALREKEETLLKEWTKSKKGKEGYKYQVYDNEFSLSAITLSGKKIVLDDLSVSRDFVINAMKNCTEFANAKHLPREMKTGDSNDDSDNEGDFKNDQKKNIDKLGEIAINYANSKKDDGSSELDMTDFSSEEFDDLVEDWAELDRLVRGMLETDYSYVEYAEYHEDKKKLYIEGNNIMPDFGDEFDLYNYRCIKIVNRPCVVRGFTSDESHVELDQDIENLLSIQGNTSPYYVAIK